MKSVHVIIFLVIISKMESYPCTKHTDCLYEGCSYGNGDVLSSTGNIYLVGCNCVDFITMYGDISTSSNSFIGECKTCFRYLNKPPVQSYQSCPDNTTCATSCPAGTYLNQCFCRNCTAGSFCTGDNLRTSCPTGTYNPYTGSSSGTSCLLCPPGKYSGTLNATDFSFCSSCPVGTYCNTMASQPTPCPAGTFGNSTDLTSALQCQACEPGYYCVSGSTAQTKCPVGTFSDQERLPSYLSCQQCPPGKYNDATAVTVCVDCAAGYYNPYSGADNVSKCLSCQPGKYCPVGSKEGINCTLGRSNKDIGSSAHDSCTWCLAPFYADVTGLSACKQCTPCSAVGQFRLGCGNSTAGICAGCTN